VAGPVIAVQTQKWVEWASETRRLKRWIFYSLMSNRATRLNEDYIKALNLIDLEFRPSKWQPKLNEAVIAKWRILFGKLSNAPEDALDRPLNIAWNLRCNDKLIDLLSAMSIALGFKRNCAEESTTLRARWIASKCSLAYSMDSERFLREGPRFP
jgi:hypothetical protein